MPGADLGRFVTHADDGEARRLFEGLQRTAGNASVEDLIEKAPRGVGKAPQLSVQRSGGAEAVQREAHAIQRLSAAEKNQLEDAGLVISKAIGEMAVAVKALDAYGQNAPRTLSDLRRTFDDTSKLYEQGRNQVNLTIDEAKEIAEVKNEVLMMVINAATEGLTSKIKLVERELPEGESWSGGNIESFTVEDLSQEFWHDEFLEPVREQVSKGMKEAMAPPKVPPAAAIAGGDELNFLKSFNQLEGQALRFLPIATLASALGQPIGRIDEAIKNALELGKTRKEQPVAKILSGAQAVEVLAGGLASWAPAITQTAKDLDESLAVAKAIAPPNAEEAEKEIWIDWASRLGAKDYGAVNDSTIRKKLTHLGIYKQLGIDPGMWYSDKEQAMTVCMARALRMVAAKRGTTLTFTIHSGNILPMALPDIPYDLPVRLMYDPVIGQSSWRQDVKVEAVVMGGEKLKEADTDVLSQTSPKPSAVAEYLLRNRYVGIVVKGLRNVLPEFIAPKDL